MSQTGGKVNNTSFPHQIFWQIIYPIKKKKQFVSHFYRIQQQTV